MRISSLFLAVVVGGAGVAGLGLSGLAPAQADAKIIRLGKPVATSRVVRFVPSRYDRRPAWYRPARRLRRKPVDHASRAAVPARAPVRVLVPVPVVKVKYVRLRGFRRPRFSHYLGFGKTRIVRGQRYLGFKRQYSGRRYLSSSRGARVHRYPGFKKVYSGSRYLGGDY